MLYSLLGNWRIRMYLFFFGLALLPLGISWCIPAVPPLMPEKFIEKFASDNAVIPAQTIVVSDAALRDAAAWTLKNSTVAEAENAADLINDPQRTKAVLCIVSPQTAKLLPREGFTHGAAVTCHDNSGVECRLYPVKKP